MSERQVIWPAYVDSTKSRSQGRVISREDAVDEPTLKEISEASDSLGLNPEMEPEKSHPKEWWEESGRVVVDKKWPKSVLAKKVAEQIKGRR